jgi:23S rRNA G2445 N2-methylase RlmL
MAPEASDWPARLRDPGFTPRQRDLPALLALVAAPDRKLGALAERAALRLGPPAQARILDRFRSARGPERPRLIRLIGKLARTEEGTELRALLFTLLTDDEAAVRRQAIAALGRIGGDDVVDALARAARRETKPEHLRSLAEALGRSHDPKARAALDEIAARANTLPPDPQLGRRLIEANVIMARVAARAGATSIDLDAPPPRPVTVWLHVRRGLEELLLRELDSSSSPRIDSPGLVTAILRGPLSMFASARIAMRFGFPLKQATVGRTDDLGGSVARTLTSGEALQVLTSFTRGKPIRYRIEWLGGGRHRASNLRIAEAVARQRPELVNDPRDSTWEAIVDAHDDLVAIELWPRGLKDERFSYRRALLPAGSHPTIAAALARAAEVEDRDVVWDPFVGSATELIECAMLAPKARLFGSDVEPRAIAAATANLAAAGLRAELAVGDAVSHRPRVAPTLIITNPPMGRRVLERRALGELFYGLISRAAQLLAKDGRMVWLSPLPRDTAMFANRAGLAVTMRRRVDMGGFWAELQILRR